MTFDLPDVDPRDCIFCSIVDGSAYAQCVRTPTENSAVVCFHNRLNWVPVMLLVVPVHHTTQYDFWTGYDLVEATKMAVELGDEYCADDGYRVISNFGLQAHQSVTHAHIHVISGASRIIESATVSGETSVRGNLTFTDHEVDETPYAARIAPLTGESQREFWQGEAIFEAAVSASKFAKSKSPEGFRFMSSFSPGSGSEQPGSNPAGIFLLGGGQLGLYGSSY